MQRTFTFLLVSLALSALRPAAAQVVTIVGGSLISAISPINHSAPEGAFEAVYLQSTINQAGTITRLAFEKSDGTDLTALSGVSIFLKTTRDTEFMTGLLDTLTYQRVYLGSLPNATTTGFQEVQLQQTFAYPNTAGLNLSVLVLRRNGSTVAAIGPRARYLYGVTMTPIRIACRRYNGTTPWAATTPLNATNVLPNLRLTFVGQPSANRLATNDAGAVIYPQPAVGQVTLALEKQRWAGSLTCALHDALGRCVWPARPLAPAADGRYLLETSALPTGTYFLHLADGRQRAVLRLARQ